MAISNSTGPSPYDGLGAVLQNGGCSYRIWAPFADQVSIGGDFFNAGNTEPKPGAWEELPMARDTSPGYGGAYWSIFIPNVVADSLYKFHLINHGTQPNTFRQEGPAAGWKHDPYARDATSFAGNSVVVDRSFDWSNDNFQMPAWSDLVIYELHVGSFNRSGTAIGNFDQAIAKLDYLAGLGINAIQVLPAFDFQTTTSMGYNTALPFAIDNAYGTTKTLKHFIQAAHAVGIAVILDVVYNHFGPQGLDDCLNAIDGWCLPGMQGIYFYNDVRIYTAFGSRPDFGRPEVRQYLRDNAMTCLSELRADGLRLDSTINIRRAIGEWGDNGELPDGWTLLRWLGEEKRSQFPWKILIAEDLQNDSSITKDALFGGMGLDSQWDSWFVGRIRDNFLFAANDDGRSARLISEIIGKSYNDAGPFQRVVYAESHDQAYHQARLPDRISPGDSTGWYARKLTTLAAAIMFCSPGVPMIFMGQEFLEYRQWDDSSGSVSLDWNRVTSCGGIVELYRRLIQLRRNWDNNTRGLAGSSTNVFHVNEAAGIIAFHRWRDGGPGDDVVIVLNLKGGQFPSYNIGFPRSGPWYLRFNSDWGGYWSDYGNVGYDTSAQDGWNQNMPSNGNVGIGPYSALIYSQ